MDDRTLSLLEFDAVLRGVSNYAVSAAAKAAVLALRPQADEAAVSAALEQTEEAYRIKYKYLLNPTADFDDCAALADKAAAGGLLQPAELLKIARLIRAARIAKQAVSGCGEDIVLLKEIVACIYVDSALEKDINACIAGENELRDDASPELKSIRRRIASASVRLKEKMASYARSSSTAKFLQDSPVTVRDGRLVLPVRSECRSEIPGIVHDMSGSGATVFIEPFPAVELNNEIRTLRAQEQSEIERILRRLSEFTGNCAESLKKAQYQCTMLDVICAKCEYSVATNGIRPVITREKTVRLTNARHPLIDKDKVVPVSLSVGGDFSVLVITGPNTGGKTVCLKTLGLMCLMAYTGLFIPCGPESSLCVFDNIFCDIGDEQSIEQSLSTFSAHIVNLVDITDRITPDSLLLLDELGAGTDPAEGAALAIGVLKYIELMHARAVVTTHYGEIKEYSLVSPNLMNACMQFDEATLKPTYRLIMGMPGVSNALKICEGLGLNDYILRAARSQLSEEKVRFEKVLAHAEAVRSRAERELRQAETLKAELEKEKAEADALLARAGEKWDEIRENAKIRTAKIVADASDEADEILGQMREALAKADNAAYLEARKLKKKLDDMRYAGERAGLPSLKAVDPARLKVGDRVIVRSLNAEGVVQQTMDKKGVVTVRIGVMPMQVPVSDLGEPPVSAPERKKKTAVHVSAPAEAQTGEVKVLGMTVSEAIEAVEPYLRSHAGGTLRIIHGKGTGALGKGIQQYLRTSPLVKSYRYGRYGEGETGVTIVELR